MTNSCTLISVDLDGTKKYYKDFDLHREDGPAVERVHGNKEWWLNGQRHREDGPAVEWPDGSKQWWLHDQLHRVDGPAVELFTGYKEWRLHDKLHREDGPALEYSNGDKYWYLHGKIHREDGPAVDHTHGSKAWYLHGLLHREDGPAVEYPNGQKEWWLQNKRYSHPEWKEKTSYKCVEPSNGDINSSAMPSAWNYFTADVNQAAFRVAAKSISKTARVMLLAFLKNKQVKKRWIKTAKEIMETEWGLAFIQQLLAWSFRFLPSLQNEPRAQALANEWAIDSVAIIGNEMLSEVMSFLKPIMSQVIELPHPSIRISESSNTTEEELLELSEIKHQTV